MNADSVIRVVGVLTVALVAVLTTLGVIWQVTHGHDVDALLAGLCTLTVGLLIPSPIPHPTSRVTVENEPDDPVPVERTDDPPPGPRRRRSSS